APFLAGTDHLAGGPCRELTTGLVELDALEHAPCERAEHRRIDDRLDHLVPLVRHLDEARVRTEHALGMLEVRLDLVDLLSRFTCDLQRTHGHLQTTTVIAVLRHELARDL